VTITDTRPVSEFDCEAAPEPEKVRSVPAVRSRPASRSAGRSMSKLSDFVLEASCDFVAAKLSLSWTVSTSPTCAARRSEAKRPPVPS